VIFLFFIFVLFYFFRGVVPAHHGAHGSQCSSTAASAGMRRWQLAGRRAQQAQERGRRKEGRRSEKNKISQCHQLFLQVFVSKIFIYFYFQQELFIHLFIFVCSSSIAAIKVSPE